jgi:hypothetical protein
MEDDFATIAEQVLHDVALSHRGAAGQDEHVIIFG